MKCYNINFFSWLALGWRNRRWWPIGLALALHALVLAGLLAQPGRPLPAPSPVTIIFAKEDVPSLPAAVVPEPVEPSAATQSAAAPAAELAPIPTAPLAVPIPAIPATPPPSMPVLRSPAPRTAVTPRRSDPREKSAPTVPATPPPAAQAAPQAAPPAPATAEQSAAWRDAVAAWLQAHKTYPDAARRDGVEGRVVVRFTLDPTGTVGDITLVQSSASAALDAAATDLLRGSRLPPPPPGSATLSITLPIRYTLSQ